MHQTTNKTRSQKVAKAALIILSGVLSGCLSPGAIKTDVQGIRNDLGRLEKIVDQKANNDVVAEQIGAVYNSIEQTTQVADELLVWRKKVEAQTINYGGAGWVVVGTSLMAVIFLGAGFLLIRAFMKRGSLLKLLTGAVQKAGEKQPEAVRAIKKQLKIETSNGGPFTKQHRKELGHFAKRVGTFANDHPKA